MRIGIDLDNTIVSYDALFHRVALEQELIPPDLTPSKVAVRNRLRAVGKEPLWTQMQGYVYGARMDDAEPFPGAVEFIKWAIGRGVEVAIISHRTRHPFTPPLYDLHESARRWIKRHVVQGGEPVLPEDRVFLELTREEKVSRIDRWNCGYFIDDLPEIFGAPGFPERTEKLLFDPDGVHTFEHACLRSWGGVRGYFEQKCQSIR